MKMGRIMSLRNTIKNPKKTKKLIDQINQEIELNERMYKDRDKELKDLLKIIAASQEIVNSTSSKN
jgi:hypothetical protein